jgi:cobyrinic acid a,c-diamide synthase
LKHECAALVIAAPASGQGKTTVTAAAEADLILVEGVMGLFDGEPSTADLATTFGIPVLAVIDASAMAQTFAALAYGLTHYRQDVPVTGVLANRIGSVRHYQMLFDGLPKTEHDWQRLQRALQQLDLS